MGKYLDESSTKKCNEDRHVKIAGVVALRTIMESRTEDDIISRMARV